jgi:hypothetical protein
VALGAAACGERHAILSPPEETVGAGVTIAARPPGPSLDEVAWSGEFVIDGDPVSVAITVTNPGKNLSNVYVAQRVQQNGSVRELGSTPVTCPNAPAGVLVAGATCTTQLSSAVQSTGGTGTIAAGAADLETVLGQASGRKGKVLASTVEGITLGAPPPPPVPHISAVQAPTSLVIEGAVVVTPVTVQNPTGESIGGAVLQAWIRQGTALYAAGGTSSMCSTPLTLPPGECMTSALTVYASNSASGSGGTLAPGAAQLEIELKSGSDVLDTWTEDITLVAAAPPSIESVNVGTEFELEGDPVPYTITIANPDQALDLVIVQGRMVQGDADRAAGGTEVQCPGEASGHLPVGGCTFDYTAFASNLAGGGGVLLPGEATLVLDLYHGETLVDTWSTTVLLVRDLPFIVNVSWDAQPNVVLSASTSTGPILYTLYNPLPSPYSPVNLHFSVTQGSARRDPATLNVHCGGGNNSIAPGFCEESGSLSVHNALPAGDGIGDLVPGEAVLEITLRSTIDNVLQTVRLPIVLTN